MNATPDTPPADSPGESPGKGTNRLRSWYASLSKGVQVVVAVIVGAGAVAGAIGAILALWPDPTPELRAELSDVSVERNVTLDDYAATHETAAASPAAHRRTQLAAHVLAATTPEDTTTTEPTTTEETTTEETTTEETTTEETTTDGDDEEPTTTETNGDTTPPGVSTINEDGELSVVLSPESRERLSRGVRGALSDPTLADFDLGKVCSRSVTDPNCAFGTPGVVFMKVVDADGSPREVDEETVAEQLGALLIATRTRPVSGNSVQPVGVTVNFNVSLTGFKGRTVAVRWSLHHAGGGRVAREWLRNQPALWLVGEAERDSAGSDFWVPLPKTKGPFFVQVGVYDEDGVRLDFAETDPVG